MKKSQDLMAYTIRTARRKAGMSQKDLADRMGTSTQAVTKWEIGENRPSHLSFSRLSRALGISREELEWGRGVELPLFTSNDQGMIDAIVPTEQVILIPALALGGVTLARAIDRPGNFVWVSHDDNLADFASIPDGSACVITPPSASAEQQVPLGQPILARCGGRVQIAVFRSTLSGALELITDDTVLPVSASEITCLGSVLMTLSATASKDSFRLARTAKGETELSPEECRRFDIMPLNLLESANEALPSGVNITVALSYPQGPGQNSVDLVRVFLPLNYLAIALDPSKSPTAKFLALHKATISNLTNTSHQGYHGQQCSGRHFFACGVRVKTQPLLALIAGRLIEENLFSAVVARCMELNGISMPEPLTESEGLSR
jgi:transcriptional regulator with XRE-family HTH domain